MHDRDGNDVYIEGYLTLFKKNRTIIQQAAIANLDASISPIPYFSQSPHQMRVIPLNH